MAQIERKKKAKNENDLSRSFEMSLYLQISSKYNGNNELNKVDHMISIHADTTVPKFSLRKKRMNSISINLSAMFGSGGIFPGFLTVRSSCNHFSSFLEMHSEIQCLAKQLGWEWVFALRCHAT